MPEVQTSLQQLKAPWFVPDGVCCALLEIRIMPAREHSADVVIIPLVLPIASWRSLSDEYGRSLVQNKLLSACRLYCIPDSTSNEPD